MIKSLRAGLLLLLMLLPDTAQCLEGSTVVDTDGKPLVIKGWVGFGELNDGRTLVRHSRNPVSIRSRTVRAGSGTFFFGHGDAALGLARRRGDSKHRLCCGDNHRNALRRDGSRCASPHFVWGTYNFAD